MPALSESDTVTIRRGAPADLPEIQRLNQALFQYEHDQGFYPDGSYNLSWPHEPAGVKYFTDCLSADPTKAVFIADVDGQTVGYLAAAAYQRSYRSQNPIGYLENMFVDADFRSQGVGSKLVDAFKDWAHQTGVARIQVGAFVSNHRALAFYRRQEFVELEVYLEQAV